MSDLSDDPQVEAEKLGKVVVLPGPDELFIDIDNADGVAAFNKGLDTARSVGIKIEVTKHIPSKTRGHYHVYCKVSMPEEWKWRQDAVSIDYTGDVPTVLTPELRIALQACLGSDRKREFLSLARILLGVARPPTVFFENPPETKLTRACAPLAKGPKRSHDDL